MSYPNRNRIRRPISDTELNRRWDLARKLLLEKELDALFAQNNNLHLGGYVRWLSDLPAEYNMPVTVVLNKEKELLILTSGERDGLRYPPIQAVRGERTRTVQVPYSSTVCYTGEEEADVIAGEFKKRGYRRIGYINPGMIPIRFMRRLRNVLPDVEFVDITDEIDLMKAIKSDEEMELIRETARIQDVALASLPSIIKPGMTEYQIRADVCELVSNLGSEEQLIFIGTNEVGRECGMSTHNFQGRVFQKGDYGTILIEVSGPGGYYCESARNFCYGEPTTAMANMWAAAVEGQILTQQLLVDGQDARMIATEYNVLMRSKGYSEEGRLYGHSQGYDLIERPAFMADHEWGIEPMKVRNGMNCSLHPYITNSECTVYINDNYHVTPAGAVKLHMTPPEIILL